MGASGLRRRALAQSSEAVGRGVLTVGLIHGITGAAALLLILPAVVSGTAVYRTVYLGGFAVGSTLAMAALTSALAALSRTRRVPTALSTHVPRMASALSMVLGGVWVVGTL